MENDLTLRSIIRKLGVFKTVFLMTIVISVLSVLMAIIINYISTAQSPGFLGIMISFLVPAVIVPLLGTSFIRLILKLDETEKKMYQMAITDELTNVYNRRFILEILEKEMHRARRFHHKLSLIMLDIDDFKKINDDFGHLIGDDVLKELSALCIKSMREIDYFARYGGEEFLYVFPETSKEEAAIFAERLRISLMNIEVSTGEKKIGITASFGVTELDFEKDYIQNFIERADMAMYEAKKKGKNVVVMK